MTKLFTIGFTKKTAKKFFELLSSSGVKTIIDTRLNNSGQLAGFSKRPDLEYFAKSLIDVDYVHWADAAPTPTMLQRYQRKEINWDQYEGEYKQLIESRNVEHSAFAQKLDMSCLLCTEEKPHHCHRRLLAEYLAKKLPNISIHHL